MTYRRLVTSDRRPPCAQYRHDPNLDTDDADVLRGPFCECGYTAAGHPRFTFRHRFGDTSDVFVTLPAYDEPVCVGQVTKTDVGWQAIVDGGITSTHVSTNGVSRAGAARRLYWTLWEKELV